MADLPGALNTTYIFYGLANCNRQLEKVKQDVICEEVMSGPDDNYKSQCIVFEVWPYGLAVVFLMYSHVFQ